MCYSRGWGNYLRRCNSYWSSAGVVCQPKPEDDVTTQRSRHRGRHRNRHRGHSGSRSYNTTISPTITSSTSTTSSTTTTTTTTTTTPTTKTTTPTSTIKTTPITFSELATTQKLLSTTEKVDDILAELGLTSQEATLPPVDENIKLEPSDKTSDSSPISSHSEDHSSDHSLLRSTSAPVSVAAPVSDRQAYREEINIQSDGIPFTETNVISTKVQSSTSTEKTTKQPTTSTTTITSTSRPTTKLVTTEMTTKKPTTTSQPRVYNRWVYDRESWRYFMYFRDGSFITSRPDPRYYRYVRTSSTMRPTTKPTTTTTTTTTTQRPTTRPTQAPRARTYNLNEISNAINSNRNTSRGNTGNDISNAIPAPQRQRSFNDLTRHEGRHRQRTEGKPGYVGDQPKEDATLNEIPDLQPTVSPDAYGPDYTEFRVVGGRDYENYKEGRIEVRLAGSSKWGVICGDNWDMRGAIVTCKHMGTGYARVAQTTDFFGGSDMDKYVATLRCTGREDRLEDCVIEKSERKPGKPVCSKPQSVAGVICETRLPDLEVDVQALQTSVYLQDRYAYYLECAFEEGCLSSSANNLYGNRRRWDYATRRLLRFSTISINIGKADFRPNIDRSKWEWHACHRHFHSMEAFSHYDIVDSHGNRIAEGHKASFCLEDSQCNRGVYPKYDCQHNGHQGISVGCRDSYLHDIDCQWIDVTDVSPGTYTLKVELNPDMLVPEISFDNNVAVCKLYISRTRAQAWGCTLGSLL